jgi:hypothetical protein
MDLPWFPRPVRSKLQSPATPLGGEAIDALIVACWEKSVGRVREDGSGGVKSPPIELRRLGSVDSTQIVLGNLPFWRTFLCSLSPL